VEKMKKSLLLAACAVLLFVWWGLATAAVTPSPSVINLARGTQSVRSVQYNFNVLSSIPPNLVSQEGIFIGGGTELGRVQRTLTPNLRERVTGPNAASEWIGTVSEQLVISETILQRAERLGISRIQYRRVFTSPNDVPDQIATFQIAVTTAGGGPLQMTSIRLYFENNLGNITIKRNTTDLLVRADLQYTGAGFLRAYWLVDGRILSYVNQYLSSGNRITLRTPPVPGLPTFREGSHTVRLVIQQPDQNIPFPKAIYYVTTDKTPSMTPINLAEPGRTTVKAYAPFRVAWNPAPGLATYLVEFFLKEEDRPVFSAYVADKSDYLLPEPALRHYFIPGKSYSWQVKGFDEENNLVGESDRREFRLQ
jgi:hypothetical protein